MLTAKQRVFDLYWRLFAPPTIQQGQKKKNLHLATSLFDPSSLRNAHVCRPEGVESLSSVHLVEVTLDLYLAPGPILLDERTSKYLPHIQQSVVSSQN